MSTVCIMLYHTTFLSAPKLARGFPTAVRLRQTQANVSRISTNSAMAATEAPFKVTEQPLMMYNWLCPYVHRVTLALEFKKANVPKVDIDLKNKPSWLPTYSPHGKVPTITYIEGGRQQVLYESMALAFWVDEYFTEGPALLPSSPAQRALARIVMARFDSSFVSQFYQIIRATDIESAREPLAKMKEELNWLEQNSQLADQPEGFLFGPAPGLADAVVAPWLLRASLLKHFRNVDILAKHPKLQAYTERLKQLPEVQATIKPPSGGNSYDAWIGAMADGYLSYAKEVMDFSAAEN